jgi:uncharacterized protein
MNSRQLPTSQLLILIVAASFPTLFTLIYFVWLKSATPLIQQSVFLIGKTIQFVLIPWLAWRMMRPWKIGLPIWNRQTIGLGLLTGSIIGLAIIALSLWWLLPQGWFAGMIPIMQQKLTGFGLTSPVAFLVLALGYTMLHSGAEEYYWRWFIDRAARPIGASVSLWFSSLGFTAHHVVVLAEYLGWSNPWTYLAASGVGIGGAIWAIMDRRQQTIAGAWISHALVDAAIFFVGWQLLQSVQ